MLPDRIAFFPHAFRHFLLRSEGSDISCNGVKETDTCEEYPSMSMMQPIVSSAGNRIFAVRKPKPTTFFLSFTTVTLNERTSEFLQFTSWLYSLE